MDLLLATTGSGGDVYPFIALGRGLAARGNQVTLLAPQSFSSLIQRADLDFVPLEPEDGPPPESWLKRWGPGPCLKRLLGFLARPVSGRWRKLARASTLLPLLRPAYEIIARLHVPGRTVVVASGPLLGARIAHDRLGVPLATVHLSPTVLRSAYQSPLQPPFRVPDWFPRWMKRASYRMLDALVLDPLLAGPVNDLRAELDLPKVKRVLHRWRHSPQLVLGLFPDWFAPPQPDWPTSLRLTGFLHYDGADAIQVPAEVQEFLAAGEPPVVFTSGSAIRCAHQFFQESTKACRELGYRALLLTRYPEQVPAALPPGMRHFDYVPLSWLLPRARALVHTGGIGTAAQALSAGLPQIVMPLKNDQTENARRLENLGAAKVLPPHAYRAAAVVPLLEQLLGSAPITHRCRTLAQCIDPVRSLQETCRLIEYIHDLPHPEKRVQCQAHPRAA